MLVKKEFPHAPEAPFFGYKLKELFDSRVRDDEMAYFDDTLQLMEYLQ